MRIYRLSDGADAGGWPFLFEGHAFLADGTPLTECDENGRIVPAAPALGRVEKDCSGGNLRLADRWTGIEALARALDNNDYVRAPILLLQLQIDETPSLAKYDPFHKPPGPGGGQFDSGPSSGGAVKPVEWSMHVELNSTYVSGINSPDVDVAHAKIMGAVRNAILEVGSLKFRPGMPGYGQLLHKAVALEILRLDDPAFQANPVYLHENLLTESAVPKGASIPDIVYAPAGTPRLIVDLKTGRATDTSDPENIRQRERALENAPGSPPYEYIQVYGN
jgi:hypothetical protein